MSALDRVMGRIPFAGRGEDSDRLKEKKAGPASPAKSTLPSTRST